MYTVMFISFGATFCSCSTTMRTVENEVFFSWTRSTTRVYGLSGSSFRKNFGDFSIDMVCPEILFTSPFEYILMHLKPLGNSVIVDVRQLDRETADCHRVIAVSGKMKR